jgi:hypothetical protein
MYRRNEPLSLAIARVVSVVLMTFFGFAARASAGPIFTVSLSADTTSLSFATTVSNFTTPVNTGGGPATAILGAPDGIGGVNPNSAPFVDFGDGNLALPWAVTIGFATTFGDGPGVDARIFDTQLDPTEGFFLYASADGTNFSLLGEYPGPVSQIAPYNTIDIDFNGTALPSGAQYLRFVGDLGHTDAFTRGLDFDAVGVFPRSGGNSVPEPGTLALVATGYGFLRSFRRRTKFSDSEKA